MEKENTVEFSGAGSQRWDPAYTNLVLYAGDRLRTGERSRAALRLSNLTVVRVGELSILRIPSEPQKRSSLNLLKGIVYFFHRDKPGEFEVQTPTTASLIRGTEFNLQVAEDGTTTLTLFDGAVEMSNEFGQLNLKSGEAAVAGPGKAPVKTAVIEAVNVVQWCLYYPGILDVDELALSAAEKTSLTQSLAAYRSGDLLKALAEYPAAREPASQEEKVYFAALLLAVGQVDRTEALLHSLPAGRDGNERTVRLAEALRILMAAVKLQPRPTTNHQSPSTASEWLADSYYRQSQSDLEGALKSARNAIEKSSGFGFGWARVAELEFGFGRTDAAVSALDKSLELAPRNAQAVALKGFLLSAQNRIAEAINYFDQAIALDGALGNAWLGRGLCKIRQGSTEAGRDDVQVAATLEPQRALFRSYLGKAFSIAGDNARAAKEIELAQRMDAHDPTAWLYSALLKQQQNRINEGVRDLERSQELNDNRRVYRSGLLLDQDRAVRSANLAGIYQDAGMFDVSVREAVRAVNADYANYSAHLFLANSYDQLRDPKQINLRYETPTVSEYLLANLLAPVAAGTLSQTVSQQEYSKLLERDRFGLASSTEYSSRGDWLQSGAQYGTFGNTSYSLDAYYRSENGQRVNNDLDQRILSLQYKQQLTPADTLYLQAIHGQFSGGDLAPRYDPAAASPTHPFGANPKVRFTETQEPLLLAGYHHEWAPGVHTLLLAGRLPDTIEVADPIQPAVVLSKDATGLITGGRLITIDQKYRSELEIYTAEAQQLFQLERHTTVFGARFQTGDFQSQNAHTVNSGSFFPAAFLSTPPQDFTTDFERLSLYGYHQWQILPPLMLVAGLSYDRVTFPANHRFAPLSDKDETRDRVSPKAGLIWTPWKYTTVRAAFTRSLGGVSFDQSFQLEPSQVAGFNQSWRSLIPDAVAGANASPKFEAWGVALDQKFPTGTYLGLSGELLESKVDRVFGVYDANPPLIGVFPIPPFIVPSVAREKLDYLEKSFAITLNQLLGEEWSLGAGYRLSHADLNDRFVDVPPLPPGALLGGFTPQQNLEATLHQFNLFAVYNHRSGFFGQFQSLWNSQSNRGYTTDLPGDDFWQLNAFVGYRFPRRRAELRLGLLNITDQDYRLNPLNLTSELPRDRTVTVSFRFAF